jgi:hypothetical protein
MIEHSVSRDSGIVGCVLPLPEAEPHDYDKSRKSAARRHNQSGTQLSLK